MVKDDNDVDSSVEEESFGSITIGRKREPKSNDVAKGNPGIVFNTIGIVSILFGFGVGIYLISVSVQETQILFSRSAGELTFGELVLAVGVALLFVVPGVICIGISMIIKLLTNTD